MLFLLVSKNKNAIMMIKMGKLNMIFPTKIAITQFLTTASKTIVTLYKRLMKQLLK